MSLEKNKQLVSDFTETIWNQRNVAAMSDFLVEGSFLAGAMADWVGFQSSAFPDFHFTLDELIAEGDKVVLRSTFVGTNTGSFFGHPPTGKSIQSSRITIYHIKDQKIVSISTETDWLAIYQQLGITPVIEQPEV